MRTDFGGYVVSGLGRSLEQGLRVQLVLSLQAPSQARDVVSEWMRRVGFAAGAERAALLVVSELVTNAVTHGGSAPLLVTEVRGECLRIEVHDDSARPPRTRPTAGSTGGFGLRVVADASAAWGWEPTTTGKVVWAELRI